MRPLSGKQMTVSQYNAPGPPYAPFNTQIALNSTYTYDNEGKMTSVTYPSVSNHSAAYTTSFDAMARPSSMTDGTNTVVSGLSYGPANEMTGINYFGYSETRSYNSRLQLTSINALQYIYPTNGANNGKASEQKVISGEDVVYSYDVLNRLILAQTTGTSSTNWGQGFSYDGFGNLCQKTGTGTAPSKTIRRTGPASVMGNHPRGTEGRSECCKQGCRWLELGPMPKRPEWHFDAR